MKKSDIALIIGVVLIIVVGIIIFGTNDDKVEFDLPLTLNGDVGLTELTYSEYEEKIDSEDPFVVIIERATCSHCVNYMPVVEEFANDYNIPIYYIDTDTLEEDEFTALQKSNTFFKKSSNWGTPTTIILVGNQAVDYLEGEADADGLYDFLSEYITIES